MVKIGYMYCSVAFTYCDDIVAAGIVHQGKCRWTAGSTGWKLSTATAPASVSVLPCPQLLAPFRPAFSCSSVIHPVPVFPQATFSYQPVSARPSFTFSHSTCSVLPPLSSRLRPVLSNNRQFRSWLKLSVRCGPCFARAFTVSSVTNLVWHCSSSPPTPSSAAPLLHSPTGDTVGADEPGSNKYQPSGRFAFPPKDVQRHHRNIMPRLPRAHHQLNSCYSLLVTG